MPALEQVTVYSAKAAEQEYLKKARRMPSLIGLAV